MMFNKYVWDNYLKSGGNDVVELFRKNLTDVCSSEYAAQIHHMIAKYCPMEDHLCTLEEGLKGLKPFSDEESMIDDNANQDNVYGPTLGNNEDCIDEDADNEDEYDFIDAFMDDEYDDICRIIEDQYHLEPTPQRVFEMFISELPFSSTVYCMVFPDFFFPYYYQFNFNVLQIIADQFGIVLPPIPLKKDYEERFYYYGDICRTLIEFRETNGLSPYEMCAFLYDFAPNYIGGMNSYIINDLPDPKGAFFIGGAKTDKDLANDPSAVTVWQCNEATRAGDMILMYLRSPISAIDSVWRACSVGFIDPFFYYYRCTYISRPIKIKAVTQNQIKDDPILGSLPIVKKNMQGINGVELMPSEYNRVMDMAQTDVFRFEHDEAKQVTGIKREKDVEDKLIKPLLTKLGYSENEYTQQLYIEIGNHNHALIPDFVLLPNRAIGHASAFVVIEAKKTIPNEKFLEETKTQARSYANLLKTKYSVIASQEKVWVTSNKDDYASTIFEATWQELKDPDTFFNLGKLIGRL